MSDLSTESDSGYRRGGSRRSPTASTGSFFFGRFLGIVLILAAAAVGWFIFLQQEKLAEEKERLDDANQRLLVLEDRLSATDNAMLQEGQDTKQQIGFWEDEIRKLWAISNDRNRNWIKGNERGITKIQSTIDSLVSSSRDLQASVDRHDSAFDQQQGMIDQLASLELQLQQIARSQRDLVDKVNKVNVSFSKIKGDLSGKVTDNVEAIESIDAYRISVNSRLRELEQRLNLLAQ